MDSPHELRSQIDVSLAIARHVSLTELPTNANLVLSPLSLNVVIGLIAAGAGGQARKELLSFLKSNSIHDVNRISSFIVSSVFANGDSSPAGRSIPSLLFGNGFLSEPVSVGSKLSIGTSVWIQDKLPLNPNFQYVVENLYKAACFQFDFKTKPAGEIVHQVNSWAEKQSKGLINHVIGSDSVDSRTRLIFVNALYFKGTWDQKFDKSQTKPYDFHLVSGDSVKAPFMTSKCMQFIRAFDSFKVLRLPYRQGRDMRRQFSMYIFLPHSVDGLPELVEKLGSGAAFLEEHLPRQKVLVNEFRIPKFKISFGFRPSQTLKKMGVSSVFEAGGLTEMVDSAEQSKSLALTKIYHKVCIEVDEEGTEAASSSAFGFAATCSSMGLEILDFVADHPFIFLIREDTTGVVLFVGHVLNPL